MSLVQKDKDKKKKIYIYTYTQLETAIQRNNNVRWVGRCVKGHFP